MQFARSPLKRSKQVRSQLALAASIEDFSRSLSLVCKSGDVVAKCGRAHTSESRVLGLSAGLFIFSSITDTMSNKV